MESETQNSAEELKERVTSQSNLEANWNVERNREVLEADLSLEFSDGDFEESKDPLGLNKYLMSKYEIYKLKFFIKSTDEASKLISFIKSVEDPSKLQFEELKWDINSVDFEVYNQLLELCPHSVLKNTELVRETDGSTILDKNDTVLPYLYQLKPLDKISWQSIAKLGVLTLSEYSDDFFKDGVLDCEVPISQLSLSYTCLLEWLVEENNVHTSVEQSVVSLKIFSINDKTSTYHNLQEKISKMKCILPNVTSLELNFLECNPKGIECIYNCSEGFLEISASLGRNTPYQNYEIRENCRALAFKDPKDYVFSADWIKYSYKISNLIKASYHILSVRRFEYIEIKGFKRLYPATTYTNSPSIISEKDFTDLKEHDPLYHGNVKKFNSYFKILRLFKEERHKSPYYEYYMDPREDVQNLLKITKETCIFHPSPSFLYCTLGQRQRLIIDADGSRKTTLRNLSYLVAFQAKNSSYSSEFEVVIRTRGVKDNIADKNPKYELFVKVLKTLSAASVWRVQFDTSVWQSEGTGGKYGGYGVMEVEEGIKKGKKKAKQKGGVLLLLNSVMHLIKIKELTNLLTNPSLNEIEVTNKDSIILRQVIGRKDRKDDLKDFYAQVSALASRKEGCLKKFHDYVVVS
ncbi:unnamed protein product [Moneuplotes crassus]|uniref:Uncharacterized protein n=1 Tax=Euplotes crassus TaxID=5936 RepID=A0AAD1X133_EUPCR|nr:unnamed protein product [Moneuplotes crassus]